MTARPEASFRRLALAGACALLLVLGGCGPGTGGTGTGPIASTISFTGSTGPAFSSPAPLPDLLLRLEPAAVELRVPCKRFTHTGAWQVNADGLAAIEGTLETTAGGVTRSAPATLRVQFRGPVETSTQATVELRDANGQTVFGPFTAGRQDGAAAPVTSANCS